MAAGVTSSGTIFIDVGNKHHPKPSRSPRRITGALVRESKAQRTACVVVIGRNNF